MPSFSSALFEPLVVGDIGRLQHRVVMAPMTRLRSNSVNEPKALAAEYYSQRASVPGTLIITEGTAISAASAGIPAPGMWTEGQIQAWKKVTDAVHSKGSFIVVQLYGSGSAADLNPEPIAHSENKADNSEYTQKTDFTYETNNAGSKPLTVAEIKEFVEQFGTATRNALSAGFDGVEVHFANGFILDKFLQTNSNTRKDEYGGSVENRMRFPLEALEAAVQAAGQGRVGIRVSPWSKFQGMRMPEADIAETFTALFKRVRELYPNLAYAHAIEPRIAGPQEDQGLLTDSNDFLRAIWAPRPFISAGGFNGDGGREHANATGDLIAFGRFFLANPDLPSRLENRIPLNPYNRATFFAEGPRDTVGYTDYPFADEKLRAFL